MLKIALIALLMGNCLMAQSPDNDDLVSRSTGFAVGGHVHSRGLGGDLYYFRPLFDRWELAGIASLSSLKELNESRVKSLYKDQGGRDFVYDKKNYAYTLSATVGLQTQLFGLNNYNKLSMRAGLAIGPTLALLKPYYVEVAVPISSTQALVEIAPYDHQRFTYNDIVGRADYWEGMGQIKMTPGLRVRAFTLLNLAGSTLYVRAIHLGLTADYYGKKLDIMDQKADNQAFYSLYLGLLIGNAW